MPDQTVTARTILRSRWLLACAALVPAIGCSENASNPANPERSERVSETGTPEASRASSLIQDLRSAPAAGETAAARRAPRFVDAREELGLDFVYDNGHSRARLMVESTGGAAGWLDYDLDGFQDLFLPQGGNPFSRGQERRLSVDQLYRNVSGSQFVRVTSEAGFGDDEFGHGTVIGDFNEDGFDDVYVSNVGPDALWQNMGDGTFRDVTRSAGINNPAWASSAAWADLDGDGDLDVYVCNYAKYDPYDPIACLDDDGQPAICHPRAVDGVPNCCYFNQGDGTFLDLANERGVSGPGGKSLGVVIADLDGDELPDIFVANDTMENHLFLNRGRQPFVERAHEMGCAMSGLGYYQASMGIAFGDYDENGFPDLYCTHFTEDSNTLYANFGPNGFEDVTRKVGLHLPTMRYLAFGTVMSDFDSDGRQDLFVANGHIDDYRQKTGDAWYMRAQMFTFDGSQWHDCGAESGPYFDREWLGRAVASADYDNDGDLDLAVIHQNDPLSVLRNDSERGRGLVVEFVGRESNRRGIGATVTVTQDDRVLKQELAGGTSYGASHQPALFFGLGASSDACEIGVRWPSGKRQTLTGVSVDQTLVLDERNAERP